MRQSEENCGHGLLSRWVQRRLDDAIHTFETRLAQTPDAAEVRHNLAVAYARHGRSAEALKQFRQALELQPDFHAARIDMATLLLGMRRSQEAIEALQHVLTVDDSAR